ncbi:MAG: helix-turn-helix domain-containing protein, partial [Eubacterium sp.]|nr:helix-turn-helix domain-containing protein [Eubacterium sp.]
MPDRKQLFGIPIKVEYLKKKEFDIYGVPLYHPEPTGQFDLLSDAAYALTCLSDWIDRLEGPPYVGIWSYDEKGKMFYLIASMTEGGGEEKGGMIRQTIGAGQYAVFSARRTGDGERDAEISRMMARYAMMEWRRVNFRETDRLGYTFEMFDRDRIYLYLPLLGDFGNNEYWRTSMQASLYREYMDAHLTEEIKTGDYAKSVYYTERWLRDSFRHLYGMTPQKYMDSRRLRLAGKEMKRGERSQAEILKKYKISSMTVFARKFINCYGAPYKEYKEPEISLPDRIPVQYGIPREIKVTITDLPRIRAVLHPLTNNPEYLEVGDYPGLVTYWFTHEWQPGGKGYNSKNTGDVDKIFIYDIHLFQKKTKRGRDYPIGLVREEDPGKPVPQGYRERILEGGRYVQFEMEEEYDIRDLMEIYQQMESSIFLKWYYDNELILSTTKEKLVRYKNGKLYFYVPLED